MARKSSLEVTLTAEERQEPERRSRSLTAPHRVVVRAVVILLLAAGKALTATARQVGRRPRIVRKWAKRFVRKRLDGLSDEPRSGRRPRFSEVVAAYLVKLACELPDAAGRSLSLWTCAELARALGRAQVVDSISPQSVQRILACQRLRPWRVHYWLSPHAPRDEAFRARVPEICDLYTRPLLPCERVLCLDEQTSLQPRTRSEPTRPPLPQGVPARLEHEYRRRGALNLFAAFDTRSGQVTGILRPRKRQAEFIELLEQLERTTPASMTKVHLVCDNVSVHHGKQVRAWLARHPRFQMHFTPVHCSWMNQVEQWFSILQRKRLKAPNFADLNDLATKIREFVEQWNEAAHPFNRTRRSFDKVLAKVDAALAPPA